MKLWKLESIRGLSALYVVCGHAAGAADVPSFIRYIFSFGQEVVMVFFLLSGFVIDYSFSRGKNKSFSSYCLKRFIRIYSVLIPFMIVGIILTFPLVFSSGFWVIFFGNILMLQDLDFAKPNVIVPTLLASALWSLHCEWWFYMLYCPVKTRIKHSR